MGIALAIDLRYIVPTPREMEHMARRRYQHPRVHRTKAVRPQWYFRARVDVLTDSRKIGRKEKTYYLGFCDEVGKRDAEKLRDTILDDAINKPQLIIQSQVKFKDVVAAYKRAHIPTVRENSQRGYLCAIEKHIEPHFGEKRMCDIGAEEVQRWMAGLSLGYNSKKQCRHQFDLIWKKARIWGYTQAATPTEGLSLGTKRPVFECRILTIEEFQKLALALEEPYRLMVRVAVFTGLRISEIRGLAWKGIDLDRGCIRVEQRKDSLEIMDVPKTEKSRRVVPLGCLRRDLAERKPAGADPDALVFPDAGRYEDCIEALHIAAKAVFVDFLGFGFHTFRRMHNTWFRKDADDTLAMQQLGHADRATNDLYVVVEREDFRRREAVVEQIQERFRIQ